MDCQRSCKSNLASIVQGVSDLEGPTSLVTGKRQKWNNFGNGNDGVIMECLPFEYALPELWLLLSLR